MVFSLSGAKPVRAEGYAHDLPSIHRLATELHDALRFFGGALSARGSVTVASLSPR